MLSRSLPNSDKGWEHANGPSASTGLGDKMDKGRCKLPWPSSRTLNPIQQLRHGLQQRFRHVSQQRWSDGIATYARLGRKGTRGLRDVVGVDRREIGHHCSGAPWCRRGIAEPQPDLPPVRQVLFKDGLRRGSSNSVPYDCCSIACRAGIPLHQPVRGRSACRHLPIRKAAPGDRALLELGFLHVRGSRKSLTREASQQVGVPAWNMTTDSLHALFPRLANLLNGRRQACGGGDLGHNSAPLSARTVGERKTRIDFG